MRANTGKLGLLAAAMAAIDPFTGRQSQTIPKPEKSYYDPSAASGSARHRRGWGGGNPRPVGGNRSREEVRRRKQIEAGMLHATPDVRLILRSNDVIMIDL